MTTGVREARTGIMGGTFDPIHLGHLDAAAAAQALLGLDEVWLVPAAVEAYIRRHELYGPSSTAGDLHDD